MNFKNQISFQLPRQKNPFTKDVKIRKEYYSLILRIQDGENKNLVFEIRSQGASKGLHSINL